MTTTAIIKVSLLLAILAFVTLVLLGYALSWLALNRQETQQTLANRLTTMAGASGTGGTAQPLLKDTRLSQIPVLDAILGNMGVKREDRIKPKVVSSQIITGIDGHQSQLINRMRHGDMIMRGQTLYILEVYPAAYAALAANEAEKAADIHLMEVISFGAFGRLWLGGSEAEIAAAAAAAEGALAKVTGRAPK